MDPVTIGLATAGILSISGGGYGCYRLGESNGKAKAETAHQGQIDGIKKECEIKVNEAKNNNNQRFLNLYKQLIVMNQSTVDVVRAVRNTNTDQQHCKLLIV